MGKVVSREGGKGSVRVMCWEGEKGWEGSELGR